MTCAPMADSTIERTCRDRAMSHLTYTSRRPLIMRKTIASSVLVLGIVGLGLSIGTSADVPRSDGDQLPPAYYARRQQDPRAFTFRRALVQQAERIRAARSTLMTRM